MTLQTFFIIIALGLIIYILGKQYDKRTLGILGGFLLFLCGNLVLIQPLLNVSDDANLILGAVLWGLGAFLFGTETIAAIDDKEEKQSDED